MTQTASEQRSAPLIAALDSLLGAASAFKNLRAIALMALTFFAAVLVSVVFGFLARAAGSAAVAFLGGLVAFAVVFYGANGVGIMMMREAQGQAAPGIADAVLQSLFSSHRLIAVAILEGLIVLAAVIVVAVLLFVCKIPALGPLLFAVVYPLSAVVLGMLVFALFYIMLPLAGPAVWTGSSTFQVIARLNMLARSRLIAVITQQVILFFIVAFIAGIIFSVVMIGFMMATGLSASIIGSDSAMGLRGFGGMLGGFGMGGSGHMAAGMIGGSLLMSVAAVIPALIATKGVCIVYLNVTRGLDFSQAEAELQSGMEAVKKKAEEARERAREMAEQARANQAAASSGPAAAATPVAPAAVSTSTAPAAAGAPSLAQSASSCPKCHAVVTADDKFCGECGHRLT